MSTKYFFMGWNRDREREPSIVFHPVTLAPAERGMADAMMKKYQQYEKDIAQVFAMDFGVHPPDFVYLTLTGTCRTLTETPRKPWTYSKVHPLDAWNQP